MKKYILLSVNFILFTSSLLLAQGADWITLENSPLNSYRHEDVCFINENTGWVGSGGQGIWKTSDGGLNWVKQADVTFIRSIGFADSMYGWSGRWNNVNNVVLFSTTNGGAKWDTVNNIPAPSVLGLCGIWVYSRNVVNIVGKYSGPARFIRTTNGGATWVNKDMSAYAGALVDCYFPWRDSGFAVGTIGSSPRHGVILFTSDGGETWVTRYTTNLTTDFGWKLSFPTKSIGYASMEVSSQPSFYLKTTNGGLNWTEILYDPSTIGINNVQGLGFVNENLGWVGLFASGPTYETTNGGATWATVNFGSAINRFRFLNDSLGFAVGKKVYKYKRGSLVSIGYPQNQIPSRFFLYQNYPNPFNPVTSIKYDIASKTNVKISVYDISGKKIITLVNAGQDAGSYDLKFDGGQFASGVYFYSLQAGDYNSTKRMVLIK